MIPRHNHFYVPTVIVLYITVHSSCNSGIGESNAKDSTNVSEGGLLPSCNDVALKQAIIACVKDVTDNTSKDAANNNWHEQL